jgi:hypothetical protein
MRNRPHPAAELGQHFVARVHLHAIEAAAVDGHHGALYVDQSSLLKFAVLSAFNLKSIAKGP